MILGTLVGILAAIMGVGGGFIMVPVMVYMLRMPMHVWGRAFSKSSSPASMSPSCRPSRPSYVREILRTHFFRSSRLMGKGFKAGSCNLT
jgi:hypothetical protein